MAKAPITIKDLARELGISKSTVSRALTGRGEIHPETKRQIIDVAKKLGYQPNAVAVHLKQQKTLTIGVIIPETVNRFFAKAIGGIQRVAELAGYNVIICQSSESIHNERKNLATLISNRVDGLLISISVETDRYDHIQDALDKGVCMVMFDRIVEGLKVSRVYSNNREIATKATQHLIDGGHKRIAFVAGPLHLYNSRNRLLGYQDALRSNNIDFDNSLIIQASYLTNETEIEVYTQQLIEKNMPDAVLAINDYAAMEMMHIFKQKGLKIPDDIAVMGFNNERIGKFLEPSLSSVHHPAYEMGVAATEMLIDLMNETDPEIKEKIVPSELIIRESTFRK